MRRVILVALLLLSGAAAAQDEKKAEKLVELGLRYRHDGELAAASAALDEALKGIPEKSPERRTVLLEAYDVAWVESKWERCARVVHGVDAVREARALVNARRGDAALEAARSAKDALAEGVALRGLDKADEALAALARAGAPGLGERAELLLALGRFADAAKDFESAGDFFGRARALERAGTPDWKPALDDVKKKLDVLVARATDAKRAYDVASGVPRERARLALADLHDQVSRAHERLSIVCEKTNDRARAVKEAELAVQSSEDGRRALTDSGKDRYGELRAKQLGLVGREQELRARGKSLR